MYSVRGRSAATAAGSGTVVAALWNGHPTQRIRVIRVMWVPVTNPDPNKYGYIQRTSNRGTPGSTVAPTIANHSSRGVAPVSGVVLDLSSYSVEPALGGILMTWCESAIAGSGEMILDQWSGVIVPPGTGLAIRQLGAPTLAYPACEVTYFWEEDMT